MMEAPEGRNMSDAAQAAKDHLARAERSIREAQSALADAFNGLSTAIEAPVNRAYTAPSAEALAQAYRKAHKRGTPSRLDVDPELAAFASECLDSMTFHAAAAAIAARFPPGRSVSASSLHRWWHRQRTST